MERERPCRSINERVDRMDKNNREDHEHIWSKLDEIHSLVSKHQGILSTARHIIVGLWTLVVAAIGAIIALFKDK